MRTTDREITITKDLVVGHEIEIMVQSVGRDRRLQAAEDSPKISIEIQGKTTGPGVGTLLTVTAGITQLYLSWQDPEDKDFDVMEVWRSTTNNIHDIVKIAEIRADYYIDELGGSGITRYYWIRARNTSGVVSGFYPSTTTGVSGTTAGIAATEIANFAVTATKRFDNTVVLVGDTWNDNTPGAGQIQWNKHNLVYGGEYYEIAADATDRRYVYWAGNKGAGDGTVANPWASFYVDDNTYAYASQRFMIATNESGVAQLVWNASANMVIGSAFILDAAITTAKIDNLQVTGAKIANATINDAKIADLSANKLTAGTIDASVITVSNLNATNITTGTLTGRTVQTAAAGQRVVIDGTNNKISFFVGAGAGTERLVIDDNVSGGRAGINMPADGVIRIFQAGANVLIAASDYISLRTQLTDVAGLFIEVDASKEVNTGIIHLNYTSGNTGDFLLCQVAGTDRFTVDESGNLDTEGTGNFAGLLTLQSGLAVTGNITVTGTVDGVNVANHSARHQNGGADEISVAGLSGVLADAQTPAAHVHNADDVNAGVLGTARIPNLPASRITSGAFDDARIPNLNCSKITAGDFNIARMPSEGITQADVVVDSGNHKCGFQNGLLTSYVAN